jgi:ATP-dependent helicase/nuclease subunit B
MKVPIRHFLETDKPVSEKVADFLFSNFVVDGVLFDLSGVLVMVPSADSGRRLKEELAKMAFKKGKGLLLPSILTPAVLWENCCGGIKASKPSEAFIINGWINVLRKFNTSDLDTLFKNFGEYSQNTEWLIAVARTIQSLRITLANGGKSIQDVPEMILNHYGGYGEEITRWEILAKLEKSYFEILKDSGFSDPCKIMLEVSENPALPDGINAIIFAATPDPIPLAIKIAKKVLDKVAITVLVYAPQNMKASFDEWGIPLKEHWNTQSTYLDYGDEKDIIFVERPIDAAEKIEEILASRASSKMDVQDIAFGVPDRELIPFLTDKLSERGVISFDPSNQPLWKNAMGRLAFEILQFFRWQRIDDFARLVRNIFVIEWMKGKFSISSGSISGVLDCIRDKHFPVDFDSLKAIIEAHSNSCNCCDAKGYLDKFKTILQEISAYLPNRQANNFIVQYRSFFSSIIRENGVGGIINTEDEKVVEKISEILNDIEDVGLDNNAVVAFLEALLKSVTFEPAPPSDEKKEVKDLYGWLELAWVEEPILIIGGINEGIVPENIIEHSFLPDFLRAQLGLQSNDTRFARDAYLLYSMLKARKNSGKVILIAMRTSQNTEPRMPARLLFLEGDDKKFIARVKRFFKESIPSSSELPMEVDFKINPSVTFEKEIEEKNEFSVSELKAYLKCPFSYFLEHVIRAETVDYEKCEMEAKDFGLLIHKILAKLKDTNDVKVLEERLENEFNPLYGKTPSVPLLYQKQVALKMIRKVCQLQEDFVKAGWKVLETEFAGSLIVSDSGYQINCRIDRIDYNEQENAVRIIDYKVSDDDKKQNPFNVHLTQQKKEKEEGSEYKYTLENYRWGDLQLPLYASLVIGLLQQKKILPSLDDYKRTRLRIETGYILLTIDVSSIKWSCWKEPPAFKRDPKLPDGVIRDEILMAALKSATSIISKIKTHRFLPPTDIGYKDEILNRMLPSVLRDGFDYNDLISDDFLKWAEGER